jgi:hypothetical protein
MQKFKTIDVILYAIDLVRQIQIFYTNKDIYEYKSVSGTPHMYSQPLNYDDHCLDFPSQSEQSHDHAIG